MKSRLMCSDRKYFQCVVCFRKLNHESAIESWSNVYANMNNYVLSMSISEVSRPRKFSKRVKLCYVTIHMYCLDKANHNLDNTNLDAQNNTSR